MSFLHGIETIELENGPRPVTEVKTAVIGLVGIAPIGETQKCVLVKNDVDAAQFGARVPGFNIPHSLEHILAQGAGLIIVVNVFDAAAHTTAVTLEPQTVVAGKLKLAFAPIGQVSVFTQADAASSYVKGTDYNIDEYGNLTVVPGKIPNNTVLKFTYKKLNAAAIDAAAIIGTVAGSGARTGIKCFDLAFNEFGFQPKILIAPGYSALQTVAQELIISAHKSRGIALIDSTVGDTVTEAIADRGQASAFFTSDERAELCYPYVKAYDPATNSESALFPYSPFKAGVIAATDNEFGYWFSASNKEIKGITGVERPISAALSDRNSDANLLNAAGITTIFNMFGTGFRTWGNRGASYPTNTFVDNFIAVRRTADMVIESLELASLQFLDRPINQALVDDICETGNTFMRVLVGRGACLDGSRVVFDRADNTNEQLGAGQITFRIVFMVPTPAEQITFKSILDISLFKTIA